MPAETVTMEDCASNYGVFQVVGSAGVTYTVTLSGSEGPRSLHLSGVQVLPGRGLQAHPRGVGPGLPVQPAVAGSEGRAGPAPGGADLRQVHRQPLRLRRPAGGREESSMNTDSAKSRYNHVC